MNSLTFDQRFLESTRGQIVDFLRRSAATVNDLSSSLGLTDNAVRAHLLSLERDRLVESAGTVKGFRKPHTLYRLTDEARGRFPKAYGSLLVRLLDLLRIRLPRQKVDSLLHELGSGMVADKKPAPTEPIEGRVQTILTSLEELGGAATAKIEADHVDITSDCCPFAEAVSQNPDVCTIATAMIAEMADLPTTEQCDRTASPKCRFRIERSN